MTLAEAATCAGIAYDDAREMLSRWTDDADLESQRLALGAKAHLALDALEQLLLDEDSKIRLGAAKTILDLQVKHKPKRIQSAMEDHGDDLWSIAAKTRSVNADRPQSGMLDKMQGLGAEQNSFEPDSAAADGSSAPASKNVAEDCELGDLDGTSRSLYFDAEDSPEGASDNQKVGPATHATACQLDGSVSSVVHDSTALCAEKHYPTLFEEPPAVG